MGIGLHSVTTGPYSMVTPMLNVTECCSRYSFDFQQDNKIECRSKYFADLANILLLNVNCFPVTDDF